jgi:Phosphodiester glycosidase
LGGGTKTAVRAADGADMGRGGRSRISKGYRAVALAAVPATLVVLVALVAAAVPALGAAPVDEPPAPPVAPPVAEAPIVGGGLAPDGMWLLDRDGGVIGLDGAHHHGSLAAWQPGPPPRTAMGVTPSGEGYWLVGADGGVFSFGDAPFLGSLADRGLAAPVVAMGVSPSGEGYWLAGADGSVVALGDAADLGSAAELHPSSPIVALLATSRGDGYALLSAGGDVLVFGRAGYPGARANLSAPPGWEVSDAGRLAEGVRFVGLRGPDEVVSIVEMLPGAPVSIDVGVGRGGVLAPEAGKGTTTSELCRRHACLAAVNADFFDLADREPAGGLIVGGEAVRSPRERHEQLTWTEAGRLEVGPDQWALTAEAGSVHLDLAGLNRPPVEDAVMALSERAGLVTPSEPGDVEVVARPVVPGPLRPEQRRRFVVESLRPGGGGPIPLGSVVLVGRGLGAARLRDLWAAADATGGELQLGIGGRSDAVVEVGGAPILVVGGAPAPEHDVAWLTRRHPRTAVAQRADGTVLLVVADGRGAGRAGLSARELTELLIGLGAETAINLDGGGSATMVVEGEVRNRPSDGKERSISNAILLRARSG